MRAIDSPQAYNKLALHLQQLLSLSHHDIQKLLAPTIVAPYILELPSALEKQLQSFIQSWSPIAQSHNWGGFSSSLDFHWLPETGALRLIEVNTNAAFLGLSIPLYQAHGVPTHFTESQLIDIFHEWVKPRNFKELAIIDENPDSQRLFIEFLWYQFLFSKHYEHVSIKDVSQITGEEGALYNRCTDFLLEKESSRKLKEFYQTYPQAISPNPEDYQHIADKILFLTWSQSRELAGFIPTTQLLSSANSELLWKERKKLFFKPARSFGSRMVYKGANISKVHYDKLALYAQNEPILAQEFVPAPYLDTPHHGLMKWDLRCYFSKDQILLCVARFYQGQVTNTQHLGGGFAPVVFI